MDLARASDFVLTNGLLYAFCCSLSDRLFRVRYVLGEYGRGRSERMSRPRASQDVNGDEGCSKA